MAIEKKTDEQITNRDVDFAQWYTDICKKADLIDYSSVKILLNVLPDRISVGTDYHTALDA